MADSWVYFIQGVEGGLIKIGVTNNPRRRLTSIQMHSPVPLRILAVIEGDQALEYVTHTRFANLRRHGEWFEPGADLVSFIEELPPYAHGDIVILPKQDREPSAVRTGLLRAWDEVKGDGHCKECGGTILSSAAYCDDCQAEWLFDTMTCWLCLEECPPKDFGRFVLSGGLCTTCVQENPHLEGCLSPLTEARSL